MNIVARPLAALAGAALLALAAAPVASAQRSTFLVQPNAAQLFARLPDGEKFPNSVIVDPATRDVFVSTADFTFSGQVNKLMRFDAQGMLKSVRAIGAAPVLGLHVDQGQIYFTNAAALVAGQGPSKIQRLPLSFGANTPIEDVAVVPMIGAPANRTVKNGDGSTDTIQFGSAASLPHAIDIDRSNGRSTLFFDDSFQGAVFTVQDLDRCTRPCPVTVLSHDPLLATPGHSVGIGANGMVLDPSHQNLIIGNLGDDRILRLALASGAISVLTEDVPRPDGIAIDAKGNVWICASSENNIQVIDPAGKLIAKFGTFLGVDGGVVQGILGPAAVAVDRDRVLVTNFVIPAMASYAQSADVKSFSVVRIPIPASLR